MFIRLRSEDHTTLMIEHQVHAINAGNWTVDIGQVRFWITGTQFRHSILQKTRQYNIILIIIIK